MKQEIQYITARHNGNTGDILAALPSLRQYYKLTSKKVLLHLWLDRKAFYYEGAVHPVKDVTGDCVMLNRYMYDMLRPLLLAQEYIHDVQEYKGQEIAIPLDKIRETNINMSAGDLSRWYFYLFPDLACDLSEKWLDVPWSAMLQYRNKIIINKTERYSNPSISYFFLKQHESDLIFTGTPKEHELFCTEWGLNIPLLQVDNFLQLAQILNACKFFIGNQSMCMQIASGLKIPRILEACSFCPNVIPVGEHAYDFYYQIGLEYYFKKLHER